MAQKTQGRTQKAQVKGARTGRGRHPNSRANLKPGTPPVPPPGGWPTAAHHGRPPESFRMMLRACANLPEVGRELRKILQDASHPHFMKAFEFCVSRGYGPLEGAPVSNPLLVIVQRLQQLPTVELERLAAGPTDITHLLGGEAHESAPAGPGHP